VANPPLRLIPADKLAELPPTEILGTTRFVARGLNVVFGPSGAYKSFYTLDASLRIAQTQPIVYVAAEGVGGLYRRVAAWCEHNQCGPGLAYFVDREVNLLSSEQVAAFGKCAAGVKPVMVVFDTLARCIPGGDENSAKDMGVAVQAAGVLQRGLKAAVSWIHHSNRAERGERGSGALRGASDSMIEIFPNGDGSIRVSCSKSKDEEPWVGEQLSFKPVGRSGVLVPTIGYAAFEYSEMEVRILEFLSLSTFKTAGARVQQIVNALNIPERSVYRLLSHLKQDEMISQGKQGDPFRLTEEGSAKLCQVKSGSAKSPEIMEIVVE
jgi:predicted transcriptional regulator